jgi:hypothetical protein
MARPATFRRGISLGLFASASKIADRRAIYAQLLDEIRDAGATDVQIVVRWGQQTVHAPTLAPWPGLTPTDAELTGVLQDAHARGLRVFLLPIVHVQERAIGVWRGTLAPPDPAAWWASYRRFILHYAALGKGAAGLYAVGSELLSWQPRVDLWRALIADVRAVYPGQLTYSSNWDSYTDVHFWDALDVVGLTAYHELTEAPDPSEAVLIAGWKPFTDALLAWASAHDRRVVFTEVGYPAVPHAAARPWDHRAGATADPALQHRCYRALFKVWHDQPRLAGLYLWNWFGEGGAHDHGYSPRKRAAARVVRHWFRPEATP